MKTPLQTNIYTNKNEDENYTLLKNQTFCGGNNAR